MNNYAEKLLYLLSHQKHECPVCLKWLGLSEPIHLHHLMSKSKWAIKAYPLLIHSLLNLIAVHEHCHLFKIGGHRMTPYNAERRERFLECHKKWAIFVNSP